MSLRKALGTTVRWLTCPLGGAIRLIAVWTLGLSSEVEDCPLKDALQAVLGISVVLLGLAVALSGQAHAIDLARVLNSPKPCFKQIYSAQHLNKHPRQMVAAIGLESKQNVTRSGQFRLVLSVKRRGDGARFSSAMFCRFQNAQLVVCGVEGDGGTFTVSIGEFNGRKRLKVQTSEINLAGKKGLFGFGANTDDNIFYLGSYRIHHCPV